MRDADGQAKAQAQRKDEGVTSRLDISDPRLFAPLGVIMAACAKAELLNDSRTAVESVGGSGKPGSRPPGEQQCPWLVDHLANILDSTARKVEGAVMSAVPKERKPVPVRSMGGVPIEEPEPGPVVLHRRTTSVTVRQGRLLSKFSGSGCR